MFVGRENELETLERAYDADVFQMVVVYGRRRVGKTTLLTHFAQDKPTLFFTPQQQTDADNLADFSVEIAQFFSLPRSRLGENRSFSYSTSFPMLPRLIRRWFRKCKSP